MTRMRRAPLALAALVLWLAGLPAGALASAQVPFKGWDAGHFEVPGACATGVQVVIGGSGVATHLGRYSYTAIECFDPVGGGFAGSPTFIAANGDRINGTYVGTVGPTSDPDVIRYDEVITIAGGTGRFAAATGELHVEGWANLATGEYRQLLTGSVSIPG